VKRGHNELVGLRATMSKLFEQYSLTYHYRWMKDGQTADKGTLRGYDMKRHIPVRHVLRSLRFAYAPAILSIWRHDTQTCIEEYYQFEVGATPSEMGFLGSWEHWAQL